MWLLDFRWYPIVGSVALLALLFGFWQGHNAADRSAQVKQLEQTVATANATIAALEENTRRANAAAAAYSQRESQAQEDLAETRELIDALAEPDVEVCVLRDADVQRLREIAVRASRSGNHTSRTPLNVRVTRPGASSP
jgi:multidrug resistance efflux pump